MRQTAANPALPSWRNARRQALAPIRILSEDGQMSRHPLKAGVVAVGSTCLQFLNRTGLQHLQPGHPLKAFPVLQYRNHAAGSTRRFAPEGFGIFRLASSRAAAPQRLTEPHQPGHTPGLSRKLP